MIKKVLQARWAKTVQQELDFFENYLQQSVLSEDPLVSSTALHIVKAGGKRVRPIFAILAARINHCDINELLPLLTSLELVHTGSLMHDDVIDGANKRRGIPTANAMHGNQTAIFVGDFLVSRAFELVSVYQDDRINQAISKTITEMCKGELRQIADFYRLDQTIEDYFYRIERKTALLFATSCETGACVSGASEAQIEALRQYGYYLGMAFQIFDDILDMTADEKVLGKPVGSDLRQGNLSLPVIYALSNSPWPKQLRQAILDSKQDPEHILRVIDMVEQCNGMGYGEEIAQQFIDKAMKEVDKLPQSKHTDVLREIAHYMIERSY